MFLKRLTCQGFKSFADKTDFDFRPGVTGIVGPNGCGKSNVVDAIKWVLGDQSARSLRGKQMLDVIFNGSGTRRSAGMAQVDLMFDNADRALGCDADDVTITRRLFRSGESEYLINNETVRLKDVRELFMDTGIGVSAYSIIEQGKVDVLLQANPQERRLIFDEAAGISRYKARKREAERKLDRVEQNLLRVEDIVEEVEKRLRSIKYQAGKARNFQEYDRQLRAKRATFSLAEYHRLMERQVKLGDETAALSDQATGLRTTISSAEARAASVDAELLRLEAELRQVEQQQLATANEMSANKERIQGSRQRLEELTAARGRAQQRLAAERQRASRLRQQIEAEESGVQSVEAELHKAHQAVDSLTVEDRELSRGLTQLQAQSEDEKAGIIESLRRGAQLHNEIASLDQRRQQLENECGRLSARGDQIRAELEELLQAKAQIDTRAAEIEALIRDHNEQLEARKGEAQRLDATRAELNGQLAAAKEHRSGLMSRRHLLLDLDRKREGVDAGVRELLHRKEQDPTGQTFGYVRGMVADLIAVDVSHAVLIETALGEFDQYLVVEDSQAFFTAADTLADFPGRVQALCMDRLPPFMNGCDFASQEGFVDYAMNLVRYPAEAEHLVKRLLGKTIVVRTLEDAIRLARENPPSYRYVTLSGQLLDPEGLVQLGPAGARTGLISRKSELREIDAQIAEVDERIETMAQRLQETSAEIAHAEQVQQQLRDALYEARRTEVENNAARNTNGSAIHRLTQEQPLIAGEMQSLEMQIREAAERSARSSASLTQVEEDKTARELRIKGLDEQIVALNERRTQLNERITEAKVAVGQLAQRRSMLADRLRGLRESQQASDDAVRGSAQEADDAAHRIVQAERVILTAESRLAELFATKERLDRDILGRQHAREQMRYELEQTAARVKSERAALEELENQLHAHQMELQEVRIRVEELVARVRDELSIDLAEVHAGYQHEEQDWDALEAEIDELKEKIRRLGNVNLDAISEQDELEKRAEFLVAQRDDLRESRRQLQELIEQLNQECRQRFSQTFETVRGHFQELFRKLFGGGKADILMEAPPEGQPLDVLEAGIEIQARPPGKELQSISLMSGGEKTMTAISLLLAIFRSRPSPFAVLDEVDAALDEANNERFNRIVQEFLDQSQFLIITHSKRTMSVADVLYGVTMQEAGVSKRVSVKFDSDEGRASTAAVA
jgi:chromosome segregation protein